MSDNRATPERAAEYAEYMTEAATILDDSIGQIVRAMEGDNTTVFFVGTSAIAPIHTQVNINTALVQAGLLALDYRSYVIVEGSQAIAVGNGGSVYIYINLVGRQRNGIVSEGAYSQVQDQIVMMLNGLVDPITGEPVFVIVRRDELQNCV
jgi:predicted AlkP superfamily phosphohydrolase/phosphomutase